VRVGGCLGIEGRVMEEYKMIKMMFTVVGSVLNTEVSMQSKNFSAGIGSNFLADIIQIEEASYEAKIH
jgi:hypothetical protein